MSGDAVPATQLTLPVDTAQYLLFRVNDQRYGLPLSSVRQVLPMATLSRPPGAASLLAGFLNLRGQAVAVVALAELFEIPAPPPGLDSHLILLHGELPVALLVGRVDEVVEVAGRELLGVQPGLSLNDCAGGMLSLESRSAVLLIPERILLGQERKMLAELAQRQQRRLDELETSAS